MNPLLGLALVLSAGTLNGSYALPMKKTTRWKFENTWLVYSVVAMLVLNWAIALSSVPNLTDVYVRAGMMPVTMAFAFGLIWGLGNLLFGAGIYLIGISLTFPICIGLSTALGSLIPMALDPQVFLTPAGATITLGVAVLVAGVVVCALAGLRMDAQAKSSGIAKGAATVSAGRNTLGKGLAIVLLSGLCDPFLNFAFTFGDRIKQEAVAAGASAGAESDAIWALALLGSFVVNVVYCTRLLTRNATWARFREPGTASYWFMAGAMAFIWMFSITLYGRGASMMGPLGGSAGWALFYCSIIISSTFWGIVSGEWRQGRGRPLRTLFSGLFILMVAIVILGYGNMLPTSQ
ncbi:MAG: L-rhamnose/proton symporter RhaT [Pirellulales bacterium]